MSATPFHQVPVGGRFLYEGKTYSKRTPLIAVAEEDGAQRVVPRSAMVELVEAQVAPPAPAVERRLPITAAVAAFETYRLGCERCIQELADNCADAAALAWAKEEMENARKRFLEDIEASAQP